jgi:hypothetical protein
MSANAGEVNRPAIEQPLFRQRGLAGVGMADDGEGPAPLDRGAEVGYRHGHGTTAGIV